MKSRLQESSRPKGIAIQEYRIIQKPDRTPKVFPLVNSVCWTQEQFLAPDTSKSWQAMGVAKNLWDFKHVLGAQAVVCHGLSSKRLKGSSQMLSSCLENRGVLWCRHDLGMTLAAACRKKWFIRVCCQAGVTRVKVLEFVRVTWVPPILGRHCRW